jgi:nitrogen fixation/metabolism regulation signal transduction histidine kinase
MEEHGGVLQLIDAPGQRGARVTLLFAPLETADTKLTA